MTTLQAIASELQDRYRVQREIGAGGMATVYLAEDVRHHRRVAIKVLRPELAAALGAERFLREIEVTASLQHPHILALYDSGQAGGFLYYVMPYVEGDSLRARLRREGQFPLHDAVRIARGVAAALAYAHRLGVVHRDIKPENILLVEGEALVADFGIARAVAMAGPVTLTGTGVTLGTPAYMSPEQSAAEKSIDGRSDIYSLGCMLYEMLAGEPPYTGPSAQAITAKKMTEPVPSLRTVRESVPPLLEEVIARALARSPADRYSSADEMASWLDRAVSAPHAVTAASPGGSLRSAERPRSRSRRALAVVGLAVGAAAAGWLLAQSYAEPPPAPIVRSSIILPDSIPLAFVGKSPSRIGRRSLAISRDGRMLVYTGLYNGQIYLFTRSLEDESIQRLEGTEGAYGPFFSPDGRWVAFFSEQTLKKVALAGGAPVQLADAPETYGGVWLSSGRLLIAAEEGRLVLAVPQDGGPADTVSRQEWLSNPSAELPGNRVAFVLATGALVVGRFVDDTIASQVVVTTEGRFEPVPIHGDDDAFENLRTASPQLALGRFLTFVRNGRLHALELDSRATQGLGPPVVLNDTIRQEVAAFSAQMAVSDDGTIVFAAGGDIGESVLLEVSDDGRVDTLPFPRAGYQSFSYSPDGREIAAVVRVPSGTELWVLGRATGRRRVLLRQRRLWRPEWSPDGQSLRLGTTTGTIEQPVAGGPTRRLTREGEFLDLTSADGRWMILSGATRVFRLVQDGGGAAIDSFAVAGVPTDFSGDGRWLTGWNIGNSRRFEAFVRRTVPGAPLQLVTPDSGCAEPFFMPDGRSIRCWQANGYLYSVPLIFDGDQVTGGRPRRLTDFPLLDTPGLSWALRPDGLRMLVVAPPVTDTTTRLTLITNFHRVIESKPAVSSRR